MSSNVTISLEQYNELLSQYQGCSRAATFFFYTMVCFVLPLALAVAIVTSIQLARRHCCLKPKRKTEKQPLIEVTSQHVLDTEDHEEFSTARLEELELKLDQHIQATANLNKPNPDPERVAVSV